MFIFPFSTLHELNLDWILAKVKNLMESVGVFQKTADEAKETSEDAKAVADHALEVAEQAAQAQIADGAVTKVKLSDDLQNAYLSGLSGKKVSIIGDSVSTWNEPEYKYDSYTTYYPNVNIPDVQTVYDTWWKKVLDNSGAELEVNASYSGSAVTDCRAPRPNFYQRCNSSILGNPDTIIVALGSNDSMDSVALGDFDYTTAYTQLSEATFNTAYIKGIKALQALYPNADIICVVLYMGNSYASSICKIAEKLGCYYALAQNFEHGYTIHPNKHGMWQIASMVSYMKHSDKIVGGVYSGTVIQQDSNYYFKDNAITLGTPPSSDRSGLFFSFTDIADENMGYLRNYYLQDGTSKIRLASRNINNGTPHTNYMEIGTDGNGNNIINLSDVTSWLTALGLVTTEPTYTVVDPLPANVGSLGHSEVTKNGKVVAINFNITLTGAVSTWSDIVTGLPAPTRTLYFSVSSATANVAAVSARLNTSGVLSVRYGDAGIFSGQLVYIAA